MHGTLSDWLDAFIVDRRARNVSAGSIQFYKQKLKLFVWWCQLQELEQITDITPHHLRLFLLYLEETGHNPGGRHAFYRTMKTLLNFFEEEMGPDGWKNPIRRVAAPRVPERILDPVSISDVGRLVGVCDQSTFFGARDRAIFMTLLDTGIRATELVQIDLANVNLVQGSIQIFGKGRKVRTVLFGKKTRRSIRFWLRKRGKIPGPLFTKSDGSRFRYTTLRMLLERRCKLARVVDVSLHDFRRAFCLNQLQAGTPETTIARLMGHSNTQLIAIYARQTTRDLIEVGDEDDEPCREQSRHRAR